MKINLALTILIGIFLSASIKAHSVESFDNSIKNFKTDGCTLFVDGTPSKPGLWRYCCVEHDMRYWFGGDQQDMDKADLRLKSCVKTMAGATWAELIYRGVRIGHRSPIKNKTAWGWGWETMRPNIPLTSIETDYIIEEIYRLPYDSVFLQNFIELNFSNFKNEKI